MLNAMRSRGLEQEGPADGLRFSASRCSDAIKEGDVDGTIVQDPYRMGYLGVWTLVQHLRGRRRVRWRE